MSGNYGDYSHLPNHQSSRRDSESLSSEELLRPDDKRTSSSSRASTDSVDFRALLMSDPESDTGSTTKSISGPAMWLKNIGSFFSGIGNCFPNLRMQSTSRTESDPITTMITSVHQEMSTSFLQINPEELVTPRGEGRYEFNSNTNKHEYNDYPNWPTIKSHMDLLRKTERDITRFIENSENRNKTAKKVLNSAIRELNNGNVEMAKLLFTAIPHDIIIRISKQVFSINRYDIKRLQNTFSVRNKKATQKATTKARHARKCVVPAMSEVIKAVGKKNADLAGIAAMFRFDQKRLRQRGSS